MHQEWVKPGLAAFQQWFAEVQMRFVELSMLLIAALSVAHPGPAQSAVSTDTQQLERLEQVWNTAHEQADVDALQQLWADDLEVDVPRMPVMTKTDALNFARSGHMKFLRYATSDIRIRLYGDAAVVSGRLQRTRSMNGKELADDWRFTKVYIREAQRWRVVSFHTSEAAQF